MAELSARHDTATGEQAIVEMSDAEGVQHRQIQADAQAGEAAHRSRVDEVARQRDADIRTLTEHDAIPGDLKAAILRLVGAS